MQRPGFEFVPRSFTAHLLLGFLVFSPLPYSNRLKKKTLKIYLKTKINDNSTHREAHVSQLLDETVHDPDLILLPWDLHLWDM